MPLLSSLHALILCSIELAFLLDVVRIYRIALLLIHWESCTALERMQKSACYCGCCFAKAPQIVTSVHAAKLLRSPEVWQNAHPICSPQMCSGESVPHTQAATNCSS